LLQAGRRGAEALAVLASVEKRAKYNALTAEEKEELLQEHEEHKATKETATRTSTRSRVSDITHTVQRVEQEVSQTKSCELIFNLLSSCSFCNLSHVRPSRPCFSSQEEQQTSACKEYRSPLRGWKGFCWMSSKLIHKTSWAG
jgi:hypothetical protein